MDLNFDAVANLFALNRIVELERYPMKHPLVPMLTSTTSPLYSSITGMFITRRCANEVITIQCNLYSLHAAKISRNFPVLASCLARNWG